MELKSCRCIGSMILNFKIGDIVESKLGHDKTKKYIIFEVINDRFLMVVNGKIRSLDKPKIKNVKHLKYLGESQIIAKKIINKEISDSEIQQIIESFEQK